MARDYIVRSKGGLDPAIDGNWAVSGDMTVDGATTLTGATTQTGALSVTGALTFSTGLKCVGASIAANGTLAGKGLYVFNGANGNVNLPLVATYDGYIVTVANINGTGTCTIIDNATDSAAIVAGGASGTSLLVTPYTSVTLRAYAAGTVWVGVN